MKFYLDWTDVPSEDKIPQFIKDRTTLVNDNPLFNRIIDISSIKDLVDLMDKLGEELIIRESYVKMKYPVLEIYNGYRE